MSEKIAIDVGHGFTKAISESGERVIFPSLIAPAPAGVDLGEFGPLSAIEIGGSSSAFVVGEEARQIATPLWSRSKAEDENTLRLALVAAAKLGADGAVALSTGLPLSWFGPQRKSFKEALGGYGEEVRLPGLPPRQIWFESVKILPQGLSAGIGLLSSSDRQPGEYAVIDIGYRTSDYVIVERKFSGELKFHPEWAGSLEIGMHSVAAQVATGLERQYHVPFSAGEVEKAERVSVEGQSVALEERRRRATVATGQALYSAINEVLDVKLRKVQGILVVGGGSIALGEFIPRAIIIEDPQWANVSAYLGALMGT